MKKIIGSLVFLMSILAFIAWDYFIKPECLSWSQDYPAAVMQAKKEHKHLLLFFSHLDSCQGCQLEYNLLDHLSFKRFALKHLIIVSVDIPKNLEISAKLKAQNEKLLHDFQVEAFPSLIILSVDEKELWRQSGFKANFSLVDLIKEIDTL